MNQKPCAFPLCPAITGVDAKTFCPVHSPDQVLARVRAIIKNNFDPYVAGRSLTIAERTALWKLRDDILHDLTETV
jgi:hypothetical protein